MPRPFHDVVERLSVIVVVVAVADIAEPPHVATRALDESSVWVSITLVADYGVGRSRDLDDAPASIADIAGCDVSSRSEADTKESNKRNHGRSSYGGMWRIGASAVRHRVWGAVAAAGCGASARQRRGIVSKVQHLRKAVAHWRVGGAVLCPIWVEIFASLFENTFFSCIRHQSCFDRQYLELASFNIARILNLYHWYTIQDNTTIDGHIITSGALVFKA